MEVDEMDPTGPPTESSYEREEAPYAYEESMVEHIHQRHEEGEDPQVDSMTNQQRNHHATTDAIMTPACMDGEDSKCGESQEGHKAFPVIATHQAIQHGQQPIAASAKSTRKNKMHSGKIGLQNGAIKSMQVSMATFMQTAAKLAAHDTTVDSVDSPAQLVTTTDPTQNEASEEDYVSETPDSQQSVEIGESRLGTAEGDTDLPKQIGLWLASFDRKEITVAMANVLFWRCMLPRPTTHKVQ
ncbi:hypothetical protein GN958_ATG06923 [Phytophthora infestans]|uniref:Uncharacterized protein n=1 Tax=Phytophthora infestans TaxID=4787 RepID=A0A8S9UVS5_PHYIN|nr:hypothetical protein GN958_ATG06923 [Phytophthora infestans]